MKLVAVVLKLYCHGAYLNSTWIKIEECPIITQIVAMVRNPNMHVIVLFCPNDFCIIIWKVRIPEYARNTSMMNDL